MMSQASQTGMAGHTKRETESCTQPCHSTVFTDLGMVSPGETFHVVATMVCYDAVGLHHLMESTPRKRRFYYDGILEFGHKTYSFMDVCLVTSYPVPVVKQGLRGKIMTHDDWSWKGLHTLVELCSGMGCMGVGALCSGITPQVAVDQNHHMIDLYKIHSPVHGVVGNVGDPTTIFDVWKYHPSPCAIGAGFNCQPFSHLGDGKSAGDTRAMSLPQVLEASWLLRAPLIILENVEPALNDAFVQRTLKDFVDLTGFNISQTILRLDDVWVSRRARWWCVLSAPELGPVALSPGPKLSELDCIGMVIPEFTNWCSEDETALNLTEKELLAFGFYDNTIQTKVVNLKGKAPTALHAWGSQVYPCACGCRAHPFSSERLRTKGIFGLLVPHVMQDEFGNEVPGYRHVHPCEVSALNGFDPLIDLGDNVRLALSALGQMASPLQSIWIFSQVAEHLEGLRYDGRPLQPIFNLQAYRAWLMNRCLQLWTRETWQCDDSKFAALVSYWGTQEALSVEQLMDPARWHDTLEPFFCIGHVLDAVIRDVAKTSSEVRTEVVETSHSGVEDSLSTKDLNVDGVQNLRVQFGAPCTDPCTDSTVGASAELASAALPPVRSVLALPSHDDAETPWLSMEVVPFHELPPASCHADPMFAEHVEPWTLSLALSVVLPVGVSLCVPPEAHNTHILLVPVASPCVPFLVPLSGPATLVNLLDAEFRLHADLTAVHAVTDLHGRLVQGSTRLVPGQVWVVWPNIASLDLIPPVLLDFIPQQPEPFVPSVAPNGFTQDLAHFVQCPDIVCEDALVLSVPPPVASLDSSEIGFGPIRDSTSTQVAPYEPAHPIVSATAPWTLPAPGLPEPCDLPKPLDFSSSVSTFLLSLVGDQLLVLRPPVVESFVALDSLLLQQLPLGDRTKLLENQGTLVGDDEIRFHLHHQVQLHNARRVEGNTCGAVVLDPLLATTWISHRAHDFWQWCTQVLPNLDAGASVVTAVAIHGHWIPLQFRKLRGKLLVFSWDDPKCDHVCLNQWFENFACHVGCNGFSYNRHHRLFLRSDLCGAMSIAFLAHALNRLPLPETPHEAEAFHLKYRATFCHATLQANSCPRPWIWGKGQRDPLATRLSNLLAEHGVPTDLSLSRAQAAIKALSPESIETALKHKDPWRQLKTLGNQNKFQYLLPSELKQLIETNKGKQVGRKPQKGRQKRTRKPAEIIMDPDKLTIIEGAFRSNGHPLSQISLSQVGPTVAGIALATLAQAMPYLKSNKPVSSEPLGIIVCEDISAIPTMVPHIAVTVPCKCALNGEPVLLDAHLFQLGGSQVHRHVEANMVALNTIPVSTVKVIIFRDELEVDWSEVCRSPIRFIVSQLPQLRACTTAGCKCGAWHNPNGLPIQDVIMDVWYRQFLKAGFVQCRPLDATMYTACLRVPEELTLLLLAASGMAGVYVEPRSEDGKQVAEQFAVLWTPKMPKSDLIHLRQTRPEVLGLARVAERRGLRTTSKDAETLHKLLRPDSVFLPAGPRLEFLAGPIPFGCDRRALGEALKKLGWAAKPLQPASTIANKGVMWLIHSVEEPPSAVFHMSHGEVVVTRNKGTVDPPAPQPAPVGAADTLALCGRANPQEDLLQIHDPWRKYPATAAPVVSQPSATESMKLLEQRVKQAVLDQLPDHVTTASLPMEQDDVPDRIVALESQVQQLMSHQGKLEQTVADQSTQQQQQFSLLQQQLHSQGQQLNGKMESHQQNLSAMFEHQMAQLRNLLSKRRPDDHE